MRGFMQFIHYISIAIFTIIFSNSVFAAAPTKPAHQVVDIKNKANNTPAITVKLIHIFLTVTISFSSDFIALPPLKRGFGEKILNRIKVNFIDLNQ